MSFFHYWPQSSKSICILKTQNHKIDMISSTRFNSLSASGVMGLAKCCNGSTVTRISGVLGSRMRRFEGFFTCPAEKKLRVLYLRRGKAFVLELYCHGTGIPRQFSSTESHPCHMSSPKTRQMQEVDIVMFTPNPTYIKGRYQDSYQQTYQHSLIQINIPQLALLSTVNRELVLMGVWWPSITIRSKTTINKLVFFMCLRRPQHLFQYQTLKVEQLNEMGTKASISCHTRALKCCFWVRGCNFF